MHQTWLQVHFSYKIWNIIKLSSSFVRVLKNPNFLYLTRTSSQWVLKKKININVLFLNELSSFWIQILDNIKILFWKKNYDVGLQRFFKICFSYYLQESNFYHIHDDRSNYNDFTSLKITINLFKNIPMVISCVFKENVTKSVWNQLQLIILLFYNTYSRAPDACVILHRIPSSGKVTNFSQYTLLPKIWSFKFYFWSL